MLEFKTKKFVFAAGFLILVLLLYFVGDKIGNPLTNKSAGNNQLVSSSQPYSSLDLRVAGTAIYQGVPVKKLQDLGLDHNVDRHIFSFAVPADHLTEYGLLTTPRGAPPAGGWPIIILIHGYIQPAAYSTKNAYISDMEWYSQHGFAVFKPDLRGQGLSIHAGQPEGAYYSMAYNTDIMSLIAALKLTPNLNASNINLWGHSMGAYVAVRVAVLSPDIRTVILLATPLDFPQDMYSDFKPRSDYANPAALKVRKAALKRYGTPLNNPVFWDATSPMTYLANSHAYFQIHVGAKDKVVPTKFSADLNAALSNLRLEHSYYVYPNGDHGMLGVRQQVYARSLPVLQRQ